MLDFPIQLLSRFYFHLFLHWLIGTERIQANVFASLFCGWWWARAHFEPNRSKSQQPIKTPGLANTINRLFAEHEGNVVNLLTQSREVASAKAGKIGRAYNPSLELARQRTKSGTKNQVNRKSSTGRFARSIHHDFLRIVPLILSLCCHQATHQGKEPNINTGA